jgi:hypothetical protein
MVTVLYSAYNHKRATAAKCCESHHCRHDCTLAIGERHSSICIRSAVVWLTAFCSSGVPLLFSGQSSWLQIQGPRFDSQHYQIFLEVVSLEQGPLSLVSTIEELLRGKSSGFGLENSKYGSRDLSHCPCATLYPPKLALTWLTSSGRSVSTVCSWTKTTEFVFVLFIYIYRLC